MAETDTKIRVLIYCRLVNDVLLSYSVFSFHTLTLKNMELVLTDVLCTNSSD